MYIWQTKKWGEMLVSSNQAEKIIEIEGIKIEKRKIALASFGLFVIGIEENFLADLINKNKQIINKLKKLCKSENCLFIQVETINYNGVKKLKIESFKAGYYKKFITPYTAIIDLSKEEDTILSQMKPKGRYNIKLAEKKGVKIIEAEKNIQNTKIFYKLMLDTTGRNGFFGNKLEYYLKFLETIDNSKLLLAYYEDIVIASGIFIFDKEISIYYYGASTSDNKYRNLMAPFLLQWEAIKLAKKYNSKYYDFLGISSPGEINSTLVGVTDFKMKLTKNSINVSKSFIYIDKKIKYLIILLLKKIKGV